MNLAVVPLFSAMLILTAMVDGHCSLRRETHLWTPPVCECIKQQRNGDVTPAIPVKTEMAM